MNDPKGSWNFYRHSGLTIRSQLALPEWEAFGCDAAQEPDVSIEWDAVEPTRTEDDAASHWDGETLDFTVDDVARFSIHKGSEIRIARWEGVGEGDLRPYILGSAWAALGYQRGFAMLHGSAVAIEGRALLFSGAQEIGKSTMAAALVDRGAKLLVDDLTRVKPPLDGKPTRIFPTSTRMKLWEVAIDHFGCEGRIVGRDHFREDKFHVRTAEPVRCEPLPLSALVILEWGESTRVEQLIGADAVSNALTATCFRPEMLKTMGQHSAQAALVAQIVSQTPVYRLTRPRDFAALDSVCEAIERLTEDLTLNRTC